MTRDVSTDYKSAKATEQRDRPEGLRFSHVYLNRDQLLEDSARMRRRLAEVISDTRGIEGLSGLIPRELGIEPVYGFDCVNWADTLQKFPLRDVLDFVTLTFRHLSLQRRRSGFSADADRWLRDVYRIFAEENVHYTVDKLGGVHFSVDEEFTANRTATIAALQNARYANSLHAFEEGMRALAKVPADGKAAIRGVFAAAECLLRLILPRAPRLAADQVDGLAPALKRLYGQDEIARRSALKMLGSFKDWIDAAHFYRHEQGTADEVAQPPLALSVYLVSTGAAHLRWLVELDASSGQV